MDTIPLEISRLASHETAELSSIDSAHVFAVIKSTLDKLALVGSITVDPKTQAEELTQSVGEEIARMISQQKVLEHRFEELVSSQHILRTLPNKSKLKENQTELQEVAENLRQSTKNLCRNLKDNPNVAENMSKVSSERQALQLLLSNTLTELESFSKITPVIESVMAQESSDVKMKKTIEHERTTTAAVRQLKNDLKDERIDHEEKMKEKKKLVAGLKDELRELKMKNAVDVRYQDKSSTAKNEHISRLEQTKLEDVRKELQLINDQIEIETNVHNAAKDFLRRLKERLNSENEQWEEARGQDLSNREQDLEILRRNHEKKLIELKEVEDRHGRELKLKHSRESKASDEKDAKDMEVQRAVLMSNAAAIIQAYWRGHLLRKTVKAGGKGKGKKGKK